MCGHVDAVRKVDTHNIKKRPKTHEKLNLAQLFLAFLLVLLAGLPCFYLVGSVVSLVIGDVMLMASEIAMS